MTTAPNIWKGLTQVNSTDVNDQTDGQIAGLNDGGYVVVWSDFSKKYNTAGEAIVGQRYDIWGNKVGGEAQISVFVASGDQFSPAVTTLSNGNIAVAWVDFRSGDSDIYVTIYSPSLAPVRVDLIDTGADQTVDPSVTALAGGGYAISYTLQSSATDHDIVARIVSPTGFVGGQFDVDNQTDARDLSETATLSNGNFVVVYNDQFEGLDNDVRYAIFSPSGGPAVIGSALVAGAGSPDEEELPDVAALRFSGFVVVWTDFGSTTSDIRATIYDNVGAPVASNVLVNATTTGEQREATVVALADGGFLVTWEDENANLVRAQRFDADGNKIGGEFSVKSGTSGADTPEAGLLVDGRVAYTIGDVSPSSGHDVDTSIYDPRTPARNFDGVNQSDFLWQHDSGQAAAWLLQDTTLAFGAPVGPNVGSSWHLRGSGDFNADGRSDFLWQDDNGQTAIWLLNGTSVIGGGLIGPNPGPSWHVIDSGDFNANNYSDILWQDNSGQAAVWLLKGTSLTGGGTVGPNPGPSWHAKASGDFNGDFHSDILWQNDNGQAAIWLMNGTSLIAGAAVGPNPGPSWHVIDSGDFNGDFKSDILWQNDNGQAAIWLMDGISLIGGGTVGPNVGPSWHVVGAGQFNNSDTKSDILWQNDNGQAAVWLMNGTTLLAGVTVGGSPGADWDLIA